MNKNREQKAGRFSPSLCSFFLIRPGAGRGNAQRPECRAGQSGGTAFGGIVRVYHGADAGAHGRRFSVTAIQTALRAAVCQVEQTYAPDVDASGERGEKLEPPLSETTYFLPLDGGAVDAFAAGCFDADEMMARLCAPAAGITPLEMADGLELVLGDFGGLELPGGSLTGGEIVCGGDGEAFMPEYLDIREADGGEYSICEPMVFKTAGEVRALLVFLETVDEKTFFKRANIKKLIKSGWPEGYDKRAVKKEAAYITGALWQEFALLKNVCRTAAAQKKGLAVFAGYEGADTDNSTETTRPLPPNPRSASIPPR